MRQSRVGEPAATDAANFAMPRRRSSVNRLCPFRHCRQRYKRILRRIQASKFVSTRRVWQKPKYPHHPMRYDVRCAIICCKLISRVRHVISRIRSLNLPRAFGAMRRSLPSFATLNPRNLRSSGRAIALLASLTFKRSLSVSNRFIEASPLRRRGDYKHTCCVESPGGVSSPGAHRSGRERLRSSGSYRPAAVLCSIGQWANSVGVRQAMSRTQCSARLRCRRRRLYFDIAHRARHRSRWRSVGQSADL